MFVIFMITICINRNTMLKNSEMKTDSRCGIIQFMNILIIILAILLCLLVFAIICSYIDNRKLVIRNYIIESDKVDRDIKIAFLSDMHDNEIGTDNCKLISEVEKANPDLIIIGGDMITAHPGCNWDRALKLIEKLSKFNKPVLYGMGNHEYRMDRYREDYGDAYDEMIADFSVAGAKVLRNDSVVFEDMNIQVQGLMLDRKYYKRFKGRVVPDEKAVGEYITERDNKAVCIMLAHNPEFFKAYAPHADIVLSGHVHGGIMVLPFIGGVVSPRLTLFPKYDGGRFDMKNADGTDSTMLVSRGLGSHTIPFRIFNPLELVVFEIKCIKKV